VAINPYIYTAQGRPALIYTGQRSDSEKLKGLYAITNLLNHLLFGDSIVFLPCTHLAALYQIIEKGKKVLKQKIQVYFFHVFFNHHYYFLASSSCF